MDAPQPRTTADVRWLLVVTALVIATGMAYSLWWPAVVRHHGYYWATPGDIWYSVRTAHWIGWGSLSYVYSNYRSELVTLPGFDVLLTPVVMLSSALHLSEQAPGLLGPTKPTEWLLVGPFTMCCSGLMLFACDALARLLGIATTRRRILSVAEGAALWPAVVIWGHPEDALAIGFAVMALVMAGRRRWAAAGWLLGAAVAMQLLVVMFIPLFLGMLGWRRGSALLARAAILPGFLLVAVLVPDFHAAFSVLWHQPADPRVNHLTPWVALAPKVGRVLVSGGPGRLLNGAVAVGAGIAAYRWRDDMWRVVWLAALALAARPVFEAVMVPYYVMPGVALALVAACRHGVRWLAVCPAAAGLTVMAFTHHGRWEYWLAVTGITVAMLALAWPGRSARAGPPTADDRREMPPSVAVPPQVPVEVGATAATRPEAVALPG